MHSPQHASTRPAESCAVARPFLIAAASGRALATSAAHGGYTSIVLDYFADVDTRAVAQAVRSVVEAHSLRFDEEALLREAQVLAPAAGYAGLICGSGFEDRPALLARLSSGRKLYGNSAMTVSAIKDPRCFFRLLDELDIAHPEIRLERPEQPEGWLVKRIGGAGGMHIMPASRCAGVAGEVYFQKLEDGRSLSVLFLANRERAHVVGVNELWHAGRSPDLPFIYGGAVGGIRLPFPVRRELALLLDDLVSTCGLAGLNGMDFLLQDDRICVLEINPRPTSTIELYDADYAEGLLAWHLRACDGDLPERQASAVKVRGHALVFASRPLTFDASFPFLEWCADLPEPGTCIGVGEPVCTVRAVGNSPQETSRSLRERKRAVEQALMAEAA